jgi:futalosine hydrolase
MIYLIVPTMIESAAFEACVSGIVTFETGHRRGFSGRVGGKTVKALITGIGQVNAAQALTSMIEYERPDIVIMAGCAGAYTGSSLKVGDVAVATEETYAEAGIITPDGWKGIEDTGYSLVESNGKAYHSRFPLSGKYNKIIKAANPGIHLGTFLTVSAISGTAERGRELFARYGALCENMEGAAAAQVCLIYGVPFVEIRGVSNMVENRDKEKWDIDTAMKNCAAAVVAFIEKLEF